ncbi:MAG: hypothetical protein HOB73_11945 [Planctomycetaceae bacterium]|jgi:hypothetical protein|nr:hypothetical protein [Planctomycetaceae bacterium]
MRVFQNKNWWFDCGWSGVILFAVVAAIGATGITCGQRPSIPETKSQVTQQYSIDLGNKRQAVEEVVQSAPAVQTPAPKKFSGRLPTYYSKIVNDQQRQYIYLLQWRYEQEIRKYEAHLKKLVLHRDKMIYNVLSPQQKEQLKKLQQ